MATEKAVYFVTGKGVKMYFNGNAYQNPDDAAREEGRRLASAFRNVKVIKLTATKAEVIFQAPTIQEIRQERMKKFTWKVCPR
jgi:hypothetical protein